MIDLTKRSYEKELMDRDDIAFSDMAQTLRELNVVNTRLGGHAITLEGVRLLLNQNSPALICEIGCGGGDNLQAIFKKSKAFRFPISFIGIDLNPECIAFARQQYPALPCEWICSDYALVNFGKNQPDLIFSSLFCHHFTNDQMVNMLRWLSANSKQGFFINDLHRHWLAFYLIKYITKWFSKSYLVKHDASLSVARGFKKKDWEKLLQQAGIKNYHIKWKWAFRWLVTVKNNS